MGLRSWILESENEARPVKEVMAEEYNAFGVWFHRFNLGINDLRGTLPELYLDIQDAIQRFDDAFDNEDMPAFQSALNRIRLLYTEALFKCNRRIAVKVYSEVLQSYLWIVDTDQDLHSLRSQRVSEAIYTADEIRKLKDLDRDSLRAIHKVKEVFEKSVVEQAK